MFVLFTLTLQTSAETLMKCFLQKSSQVGGRAETANVAKLKIVEVGSYGAPPTATVSGLKNQLAKANELVTKATEAHFKVQENFNSLIKMYINENSSSHVRTFNEPLFEAHKQLKDSDTELSEKKAK